MIVCNAAIRNRVTVGVLVVLIVLAGVYSYATLPREAAPDVPIPNVLVDTVYEGVSPEDIESSVTIKIEKKLTALKGVKEVRSSSAEGSSLIVVEFLPDVRIEDSLQYVRDKVDQAKADLPDGADDPVISEVNVAEMPIMYVNISGPVSPVHLKVIADRLEDAIEQNVRGVLDAIVLGGLEREIRIEVDQDRLASFGLTLPELLTLIPSENVNISAGGLETPGTKFNVRVPAQFDDPGAINYLLLTVRDGKPIYLSDVAQVADTFKDRLSYSRVNGETSIAISIQKRIGENLIEISDQIKAVIVAARKLAPQAVKFELTMDQSDDVRTMVSDLENNIAAALVLVVVVLMAFMGFRTSAVVAMAIPLSMLLSFAVLQVLGHTLNMIVLFSLVLSVGMLVDNAIVVVENIYRHMQMGYGRIEAAMKGAGEVAWPVITSTLTTVAAFTPMLFWPGIVGEFMGYLPSTVIVVLCSSLFVAMVVSPVMCTIVPGGVRHQRERHPLLKVYSGLLHTALRHRFATIALCVVVLASAGILYDRKSYGVEFFPRIDPKRAVINIRCPQGTNIAEVDRIARLAEDQVTPYRGYLEYLLATTGSGASGSKGAAIFGGTASGPHLANLTLVFPDYEDRERDSAETVKLVRQHVGDIPGAEIKVELEQHGPPTGAAINVRIIGEDFKELEKLAGRAMEIIRPVPGLVSLRSDLEAARPELVFVVDRRRAMLSGVNTRVIGNFLKTAVFGNKVGDYRQFNDEYDITVRLPESQRNRIEDLFRLRVPNVSGKAIPLSSLGHFAYKGGLGTINRINQRRVVTLTADAAEGFLPNDVLADVMERLSPADKKRSTAAVGKMELPPGYEIRYAGQKEEQDQASAFLSKALIFALLLIVLVLVAQFNTLSVPLVIMSTVVLSMLGVLVGLLLFRMPISVIMTGIGVISLAGVVVNNAIVLLAYTRDLQKKGMSVVEAVVEAGVTRFRPVMLTATTTIIALLPVLLGISFDFHTFQWAMKSESSQWWRGMAVVVVFGLGFATVLTLVVVPTIYVSLYRLASKFGKGGLKRAGNNELPSQPPPA